MSFVFYYLNSYYVNEGKNSYAHLRENEIHHNTSTGFFTAHTVVYKYGPTNIHAWPELTHDRIFDFYSQNSTNYTRLILIYLWKKKIHAI